MVKVHAVSAMYAGLGPDERPDPGKSPYPFLTFRELAEFVATKEAPDSFVRCCMGVEANAPERC